MTLTTGRGHDALVRASGDHPFVRWDVPPALSATWWQVPGAVAFRRLRRRGVSIALLGDDAGVLRLLDALPELAAEAVHAPAAPTADADGTKRSRGRGPSGVWPLGLSVPQHLEPHLHERLRVHPGGDWDFFVTHELPPVDDGERRVRPLDDVRRHEEVTAFLSEHSPTADTAPGGGERWFGVDLAGRLVATAAVGLTPAGAPSVSSVAVAAAERGRGLGRAVVGAVTRWAVAEHGVCTLGMYSHNAVARRLYHSLGYTSPVAWASRTVQPATAT